MRDNETLFRELFEGGHIRLRRGPLLDLDPSELWRGNDGRQHRPRWDRIESMMLGLAIGDALGNPSESMLPGARHATFGEVRDYVVKQHVGESAVPSDDTQLAFWTLDQLLIDRGLVPERLAGRFASGHIFGIGSAVAEFVAAWRAQDRPWYQCGAHSAGNGALMRIAPILVPHLPEPSPCLWADTAMAAAITHNDSSSTAACLAFVAMLWELLVLDNVPDPVWWPRRFVELARALEGDTHLRPRGRLVDDFDGPLWQFVDTYVEQAYEDGLDVVGAGRRWYSGAYLLETVPTVLYILMKHAHDPEEAIVRAVNDTRDNDTIAAIVGAAVGALHGKAALPTRWLSGLKGRTQADDGGRIFEILERARELWGPVRDGCA